MVALARLIIFGFIALSIIYGCVWLYSRSVRREKVEKEWAEENPGGSLTDRDAFVEKGMAEYHAGIRPKLILLIYVIPTILLIGVLIATNWN